MYFSNFLGKKSEFLAHIIIQGCWVKSIIDRQNAIIFFMHGTQLIVIINKPLVFFDYIGLLNYCFRVFLIYTIKIAKHIYVLTQNVPASFIIDLSKLILGYTVDFSSSDASIKAFPTKTDPSEHKLPLAIPPRKGNLHKKRTSKSSYEDS